MNDQQSIALLEKLMNLAREYDLPAEKFLAAVKRLPELVDEDVKRTK